MVVVVVVEQFGLEEELGLDEEAGQWQKRNEDVLLPNTRKGTDRKRVMGHEFDPRRPPS